MNPLWIDKYRPKTLEELTVHPEVNKVLLNISSSFDFPHLLFTGFPGSGKKTRIHAFIRKLFNKDFDRVRSEFTTLQSGNKTIEVHVLSGENHVEICPADAGFNDRIVITSFLKDVASSATIGENTIKVVVINDAHRLTKLAQQALRRTMEKYAQQCRLIMVTESLSQLIEPLRSRCLVIRCPRVVKDDCVSVLNKICEAEGLKTKKGLIEDIATLGDGNMRRSINMLEMYSMNPNIKDVTDLLPQWEIYCAQLANEMTEKTLDATRIKSIRLHLYELLVHCVPPTEIFHVLIDEIFKSADQSIYYQIADAAALYESRLSQGTKPIFHLEAFIAKFVYIYQEYIRSLE